MMDGIDVRDGGGAESGAGFGGTSRRGAMAAAAGLAAGAFAVPSVFGSQASGGGEGDGPSELVVLWTSADPDVAHRVGLMYTHAAKRFGWFERVRLVIWGPSQRTLVGDKDLKAKLREMQGDGVVTQACIACANTFGIVEDLRALDLEVIGMGGPLSGFLKSADHAVLTV